VAFRAALADVERHDVDLIVCLGDVAQGGPQPAECVELRRELGCPCVFGNSDEFLLSLDLGNEPVDDDVILPDTPRADVERMIGQPDADAVAAGHVHLQWLRRFSGLLWFCVGSVGLVCEHKDLMDEVPFEPWSEYALLSDGDGLAVEFRRIPFDVEELVDAARAADFPDVERWAGMWKR
jgi:predicted phosphodiesterase